MNKLNGHFMLSNGVTIPEIGFGTWQTPEGSIVMNAIEAALKAGYRHIDTAAVYGNERGIGKAIIQAGVPREELFITTKVWNTERGYKNTLSAFEASRQKLGLDYLDLSSFTGRLSSTRSKNWKELNSKTWGAIEELYKVGKIKAIGCKQFFTASS